MRRSWLVGAALIAALAAAGPAAAQDNAAAEALFDEGRRLKDAGDWAAASEKFRASDRAAPSVGARLNLGDCLARLGRNASAWASYRAAANLARSKKDTARADVAAKRAADIEPKLTYVVLEVASPAPGLEIRWDGEVKGQALWGQRFPVDPGGHEVTASAPGHAPYKTAVTAGEPGAATRVEIPALEAIARPGGDGDDDPDVTQPPDPAGPGPAVDASMWTGRRKLALGVGAAGVVALGVGSALGLSARSKWNDAEDNHCNAQLECDREGVDLADAARSRGNIATVAFVAGGAAVAGAVVLWITGGPEVAPVAGPGLAGVAVSGSF